MKTKLITKNKKAYFDYEILDTYECGIVLLGGEVKSIRNNRVNLKGSFAYINHNTELFAKGIHISAWMQPDAKENVTKRERKLLLHKKTIEQLAVKLKEWGLSLVPLSIYFKGSLIKVSLGLAKGKKQYDKRKTIKEKDLKRDKEINFKLR